MFPLRRFSLFLTVPLLVLCLACRSSSAADNPKALRSLTLQLQWRHQFQFAGYYAAKEQGYYREAGFEVEFLEGDGSVPDSVFTGRAHYGVGGTETLLMRDKGFPVVVLASIFQHSPLVIVAAERPDLGNVHELVGKRLMMESQAAELHAYLAREDVPVDRIRVFPHEQGVSALLEGRTDAMSAYLTDELFVLQEARFPHLVFSPRMSGIDFYGDLLYTSETELREHPERVKAFVDATLRGWRYALSHEKEIVDLILDAYSQRHTRQHLLFEARETKRLILPDVVDLGYTSEGRWAGIAALYQEHGLLRQLPDLSKFLWQRDPKPKLGPLYLTIAGLLGGLGGCTWVMLRMRRMNRQIRSQLADLKRGSEQLASAELRYRALSENAPFGVFITQLNEGTILFVNPSGAKMLGLSQEALLGRSIKDFYADSTRRLAFVKQIGEQGFMLGTDIEMMNFKGHFFWVNLSASLMHFEGKQCVMVSLVDVGERHRGEVENKRLIEQLRSTAQNLHTLRGMLPICSGCKKIRDDRGYWKQIELYFAECSGAEFSHGVCPDCANRLYSDIIGPLQAETSSPPRPEAPAGGASGQA